MGEYTVRQRYNVLLLNAIKSGPRYSNQIHYLIKLNILKIGLVGGQKKVTDFLLCMNMKKICGHCGYLGLRPGPASLASRPNPRALKGLGPEASRPRNPRSILRPSKQAGPRKSGQSSARVPEYLISRTPFNSSAYFPDRHLYQAKLPTGSSHYV